MKQNVNFGLLGLLLLVVVSMIGLVIYYYLTYEGLSRRYEEAMSNIENVSRQINRTQYELRDREAQLKEKERALLDYRGELNISQQNVASFDRQFTQVTGERNSLAVNLNTTKEERNMYAAKADTYYRDSQMWEGKYDETNQQLTLSENKVTRMRGYTLGIEENIGSLENEVNAISSSIKNVDDYSSKIEGNSTVRNLVSKIDGESTDIENSITALRGQINRLETLINSLKGA